MLDALLQSYRRSMRHYQGALSSALGAFPATIVRIYPKIAKTEGQIVTDGGAHAPTRTRGRGSDLCGGSSELGGGGDGRLGFVTDATRGAIFKIVKIYPKTDQNKGPNRNRRGLAPARAASGPWCRPVLRRWYYGRRRRPPRVRNRRHCEGRFWAPHHTFPIAKPISGSEAAQPNF
eukprot:COSAG05_NODE_46_length_25233_cov_40.235741_7_plen_176_part_00